jgi:hypothetical protein
MVSKINRKMAKKSPASGPPKTSQKKVSGAAAKKPVVAKKPASSTGTSSKRTPTVEEISQKAHEIYLERISRGEPGDSESDWHKAVEILKAK